MIVDTDDQTGFYFEVVGLHVQPGGNVRFTAVTPHHAVTAYHEGHASTACLTG